MCQQARFPQCLGVGVKEHLAIFYYEGTNPTMRTPTPMTLSNPNHLPKGAMSKYAMVGGRASTFGSPCWILVLLSSSFHKSLSSHTLPPFFPLPPSPNPISLTPYISSAPVLEVKTMPSLLLTSEYGTASYDLPTPWPWNSGYLYLMLKLLNIIWAIYFLSELEWNDRLT